MHLGPGTVTGILRWAHGISWLAGPSPGLGCEGHSSLPRSREQTPLHPPCRVHRSDVIYLEPLPRHAVAGCRVDVTQPRCCW